MSGDIVRKIPLCIPDINQQDKDGVSETLNSQWLTNGAKTVEFEKRFAEYLGVKYAIAVNSGTAGLHLAMRVLKLEAGDEVIVPVLTFVATANAPIFCGATPVFADVDERTFNITPESILAKITKKTKAIIVVHYAGQPCGMKEIMQIAYDHNLFVVEDCAHSLGASYNRYQTGTIGIAGSFSFYPTKPLVTGEGGMITTNLKEVAESVTIMRSHGMTREARQRSVSATWQYDVVELGYNYRMSEMQASLGITQLTRVNAMRQRRAEIAEYYTRNLGYIDGIIPPFQADNRTNSYHLYVVKMIEKNFGISRDELFSRLASKGIGAGVHYTPLHLLTYYQQHYGYRKGDFPIAEKLYSEILSLPIYSKMTREDAEYVVQAIVDCQK